MIPPLLFSCREKYLAKIDKRISEYELKLINPLQEDKKLVVLDIDCTFFGELGG